MPFPNLNHTTIAEAVWPSIPNNQASRLLALAFQLEQSQWWSPQALEAMQLNQLKVLVAHAAQLPFYQTRFKQAGFDPNAPVTLDAWRSLPLLTRQDLQSSDSQLCHPSLPKTHGRVTQKRTSGSSGQPLTTYDSELNLFTGMAFSLREFQWHRYHMRGTQAIIRFGSEASGIGDPPHGAEYPTWGYPLDSLFDSGKTVTLNIACDLTTQVDWLVRQNPNYLMTYPSNLKAILQYCQSHSIQIPALKAVRTISETLSDDTRRLCQQVWGVPIIDVYSSQELGFIAIQCPQQQHYHLQSENVFVEVIDDVGQPCQPGQAGRIVITPLHNFAMPLLRYDIRDYGIVGEACSCGRGLPTLTKILGRQRNMVRLPNGEKRWPTGFLKCSEIAGVRQFQFIQTHRERIQANLVVSQVMSDDIKQAFTAVLHETLGYPFEIDFNLVNDIPKSAQGKFEEFVCRVEA